MLKQEFKFWNSSWFVGFKFSMPFEQLSNNDLKILFLGYASQRFEGRTPHHFRLVSAYWNNPESIYHTIHLNVKGVKFNRTEGGYTRRGNWVAHLLEIFQLSEQPRGAQEGVISDAKGIAFSLKCRNECKEQNATRTVDP